MIINILGTEYTITLRKYREDASFQSLGFSGYSDDCTKQLVICEMATHPDYDHEKPDVTEFFRQRGFQTVVIRLLAHGQKTKKW